MHSQKKKKKKEEEAHTFPIYKNHALLSIIIEGIVNKQVI